MTRVECLSDEPRRLRARDVAIRGVDCPNLCPCGLHELLAIHLNNPGAKSRDDAIGRREIELVEPVSQREVADCVLPALKSRIDARSNYRKVISGCAWFATQLIGKIELRFEVDRLRRIPLFRIVGNAIGLLRCRRSREGTPDDLQAARIAIGESGNIATRAR